MRRSPRSTLLGADRGRPLQAVVAARLRTDVPLVFLDAAVVLIAYLLPLVLRFDGEVPQHYWARFWVFVPAALILHLAANYMFGLYGQVWRYASIQEARRIVLATVLGGGAVLAVLVWQGRPLPLSVIGLGLLLVLAGFGAVRFQSRLFALRRREVAPPSRSRTLVVGAGDAGAMIVRDILAQPRCGLYPVVFVDDDERKHGLHINGIRVVGGLDVVDEAIERYRIDQVLVAIPSAPSEVYRRVLDACERSEIPVRVLPGLESLINGHPSVQDIRDVEIADLIGRRLVETDLGDVRALLHGRRVLVTGAGGSIGSEIARQVASFEPSQLILLDHDETHLHDLITDLDTDQVPIVALLADIRERDRIFVHLERVRPDIVFHAAAHKHVPLLEEHPEEAVRTNVLGTINVAEASMRAGASGFVLISTDKAIRPVSVMGASKKLAEDVLLSMQNGGCRVAAVRFGNVVGSRGSVVPTFIRQIARGGPVTVTDPAMTRYFMSISEAVQLVLQAAALAQCGDVFTLDMGEPVNILDLARRMIRLTGRVPDRDIAITITGVRPGERLAEMIDVPGEPAEPSVHPYIFRSAPRKPDAATLRRSVLQLERACTMGDAAVVRRRLFEQVVGGSVRQTRSVEPNVLDAGDQIEAAVAAGE